MNDQWKALFGDRLACFDGGMGTMLQAMGLRGGERPELWNLKHPDRIKQVHAAYLHAGADVVAANTFGATRAHLGDQAAACMAAGIAIAKDAVREAGHGYAAIDMGSLGRLPEPYGDMPFEEAVSQFREAFSVGIEAGGDLVLIETMTDLLETRACVIAAKEAIAQSGRALPLFVSLTFDERGRLLSGADIPGTVAMLAGLRVDAIGLNCGHEPAALRENGRALLCCSPLPVFISPNASLPIVENGRTIFPTTPENFGRDMVYFVQLGASGLGGCCGTTPEHIRALKQATQGMKPVPVQAPSACVVSGRSKSFVLGSRPAIIGERLNPTGKKRMKAALREKDMDYLLREAIAQTDAGADVLDVNVGLPDIDEPAMLKATVQAVQTVCDLPLQLDTGDPAALEAAIRGYAGKPIINSVCGKQAVMDAVFPIAAKYGGAIVALTLDEDGIPNTAEKRVAIATRIIVEAATYGIPKSELIFDALTMTVATDARAAHITLQTVRALKEQLGVKTVLGVSNISFGLPQRPILTAAFIAMAIREGLDAAIMNPGDTLTKALFDGAAAVSGRDEGFAAYLAAYAAENAPLEMRGTISAGRVHPGDNQAPQTAESGASLERDALYHAIVRGVGGDASAAAVKRLDEGKVPLQIIEDSMMPALGAVGAQYEQGRLFLPQLLQSANAAQAAFEQIRARLPEQSASDPSRRVVIATVKGDVHDIGKNIVKVLLQNYGFIVRDLGKDVPPEQVLEAVRETGATMVGLSALMTTTVPAMKDTIALLHREAPGVRIAVGGAVLNEEYAAQIHADGYGRDAMATVRLCEKWSAQSSTAQDCRQKNAPPPEGETYDL